MPVTCWLLNSKYPAARQLAPGVHHIAGSAAVALGVSRAALGVSRAVAGPVPASAPLTTPALWLTGAERWLMLAGLAIALGGLAGRGLARQYLARQAREDTDAAPAREDAPAALAREDAPAPLAPESRPAALAGRDTPAVSPALPPLPTPWALRGSLLGLAASAALLVTAVAGPGVAARLAHPPVAGLGSRATGLIAAVEVACFALAALQLRLGRPRWSLVPLFGVALAEGVRAHPDGSLPVAGALLTFCHLLPALLWAGMLVYTARAAIAWRAHPRSVQGLFRLHGTAAAWLFAVVVVTGVLSALLLVPVGSLLTTTYGRVLLAKAALVAVAAVLALASRVGFRHPAEPGAGLPLVTRLEIGALAAVLAVTGLLTVLTPPAKPIYPGHTRSAPAGAAHPGRRPAGELASFDRPLQLRTQ